jgi:hypothetical protein
VFVLGKLLLADAVLSTLLIGLFLVLVQSKRPK